MITLSRRTLFQSAAAVAAVSTVEVGRAAAGPHPSPLKIALASYSTRKLTLDQTIDLCKSMDVKYINIKDVHLARTLPLAEVAAARAKIDAAGLIVTGGGVINWAKSDAAQIKKDFEYAKAAKFPMIVAMPSKEVLDIVDKMIKEYNIPVAIHNHGPEDKIFPSPLDALAAIKGRDKRWGVCMDIGHTARTGVDPVDAVEKMGDRLMDLHIKDLKDKMKKETQTEVGRGSLDIVGLFKALQRKRYSGHIALEYEINGDKPENGIRESIAYMKGVADAIVG